MATESRVTPYSSSTFHQTPSIEHAGREFISRNGKRFVDDVLGPLVKKHHVEESFGAGLIHRHFDIEDDEKMVEFNDVSVPWVVEPDGYPQGPNTLVYATAWLLEPSCGKWMPYEYAYTPKRSAQTHVVDILQPAHAAFLAEYTAAVQHADFQDIIGLRAWAGNGFRGSYEFSVPRANINVKPELFEPPTDANIGFTETMWFWPEQVNARCVCVCLWNKNKWHWSHDHKARSDRRPPWLPNCEEGCGSERKAVLSVVGSRYL